MHGKAADAIDQFNEVQSLGQKPDAVTLRAAWPRIARPPYGAGPQLDDMQEINGVAGTEHIVCVVTGQTAGSSGEDEAGLRPDPGDAATARCLRRGGALLGACKLLHGARAV